MWRRLTVMLFLLALAQVANASPIAKILHHDSSTLIESTQTRQNGLGEDRDTYFNCQR